MTVTFNPRRAMAMTHAVIYQEIKARDQFVKKHRVETKGRTDMTDRSTLPLTRSVATDR